MKKEQQSGLLCRLLAGLVLFSFLLQGLCLSDVHQASSAKNQKKDGGYELTVFWQNYGPAADAGTKLLKTFSDFLPPASIRFPFKAILFAGFTSGFSCDQVCMLFRILRTSICINAP